MLLDLDGFKEMNDIYGHAAGDETLKEAAHRLLTWQRPGWTSGRLGGVSAEPGCDADSIMARADTAMYAAIGQAHERALSIGAAHRLRAKHLLAIDPRQQSQ